LLPLALVVILDHPQQLLDQQAVLGAKPRLAHLLPWLAELAAQAVMARPDPVAQAARQAGSGVETRRSQTLAAMADLAALARLVLEVAEVGPGRALARYLQARQHSVTALAVLAVVAITALYLDGRAALALLVCLASLSLNGKSTQCH